jgi:hypothetical protein
MMCNENSATIDLTGGEIELIQKLEEATSEIEALLKDNDKLTKLSSELRSKLHIAKHMTSSDIDYPMNPPTGGDGERNTYEQAMLNAILNNQSQSGESENSRNEAEVACIGKKTPLVSASNSRTSKTAYVRVVLLLMPSHPLLFPIGLLIRSILLTIDTLQGHRRPKTASERATTSQRQSFQSLLNRKKKETAVEKTKIRNWNVKDPSTNHL